MEKAKNGFFFGLSVYFKGSTNMGCIWKSCINTKEDYFYSFTLVYWWSPVDITGILLYINCYVYIYLSSVQFSSVAQSCLTLCDPMNHSTPGLPVHHHLPEFTQTHVHWVSDTIQPSHPLSFPSSPAPNPSQHQSLFQWVNLYSYIKTVIKGILL